MPPSNHDQFGTSPRYCRNCHYPMVDLGEYCYHCGQKYTTGRISFGRLMSEAFEAIFNFDSKIFRTLGALFVPGKLTREYFEGRHKRYVNPMRLFFVMAVLLFAVISFLVGDDLRRTLRENVEESERVAYQADFLDQLDSAQTDILQVYGDEPPLPAALDSMVHHFRDTRMMESSIYYIERPRPYALSLDIKQKKVSNRDLILLSPDSLAQKYEIEGWVNRWIINQQIRLQEELNSFAEFMLGQLVWMVLFMMPALALTLKLLYIRRDYYYVEHLIFSFHYHAFAFLALVIALLLHQVEQAPDWLPGLIYLSIALYLLMAMKRVYSQGWIKTLFKYFILSFFYTFLLTIFFTITLAISAFLF